MQLRHTLHFCSSLASLYLLSGTHRLRRPVSNQNPLGSGHLGLPERARSHMGGGTSSVATPRTIAKVRGNPSFRLFQAFPASSKLTVFGASESTYFELGRGTIVLA